MSNYKEIAFEDFIEQQLIELHGYCQRNAREHYDKKRALDGGLAIEFIQTTQPETWRKYAAQFGELIRLAGKYDNWFTRILSAPGMWMQHLTTNEPDDSMIEVAIAALKPVLPENREEAKW